VVAVNHRSSRDTIFPAQIHDIKAAIRFVRAKATDYHIDTSFIGITGYSSGGHLSAFAGTSGGVEQVSMGSALVDLEGKVGVHTGYNSAVNVVVDWFGPTDFLVMDSCGSAMVHNAPDSPESILVGGAIQAHQELCSLANPITYVDSNDPAFLILHGDKDPLVPYCQSEMLHSALLSHKVQSQLVIIADAKHGPGVFEPQYLQRMVDFFILQMR
jgi:acetyl esterase/lipase